MAKPERAPLSETQWEIMQAVWQLGEGSVSDVWKQMCESREVARNTVLTQMDRLYNCLLYTSPSPRDRQKSRMPSSA